MLCSLSKSQFRSEIPREQINEFVLLVYEIVTTSLDSSFSNFVVRSLIPTLTNTWAMFEVWKYSSRRSTYISNCSRFQHQGISCILPSATTIKKLQKVPESVQLLLYWRIFTSKSQTFDQDSLWIICKQNSCLLGAFFDKFLLYYRSSGLWYCWTS